MLNGLRNGSFAFGLMVALVVATFFYVGWTYIEQKTLQRATEHYRRYEEKGASYDEIYAACSMAIGPELAACVIKEDDEREKQENAARDLYAQEEMALWAKLMFLVSFVGLLLTAAALWAIVRTLHQTRRAADYTEGMLDEAKEATKAAQDSVRTMQQDQRPWMCMADIETLTNVTFHLDGVDYRNSSIVTVKWQNFGRSPAMKLRQAHQFIYTPRIDPPKPEAVGMQEINSSAVVGPGFAIPVRIAHLKPNIIQDMRDRKLRVFAYCCIRYFGTIDDTEYESWACLEIAYDGSRKHDDDSESPLFSISPTGPWNYVR